MGFFYSGEEVLELDRGDGWTTCEWTVSPELSIVNRWTAEHVSDGSQRCLSTTETLHSPVAAGNCAVTAPGGHREDPAGLLTEVGCRANIRTLHVS